MRPQVSRDDKLQLPTNPFALAAAALALAPAPTALALAAAALAALALAAGMPARAPWAVQVPESGCHERDPLRPILLPEGW